MVHTTKELEKISDDILVEMEAEMNRGTDPYLVFFYACAAILGLPFDKIEKSLRNSSWVLTEKEEMKTCPVKELLPRTMKNLQEDEYMGESITEQRQAMENDYVAT